MRFVFKCLILVVLIAMALFGIGSFLLMAADSIELDPNARLQEEACRTYLERPAIHLNDLPDTVRYAPLQTLIRLPLTFLLPRSLPGLPSRLVSLLFGIGILIFLWRKARGWADSATASLVTIGLGVHPHFLTACLGGGNSTLAIFLTMSVFLSYHRRWILIASLLLVSMLPSILMQSNEAMLVASNLLFLGFLLLLAKVCGQLPEEKRKFRLWLAATGPLVSMLFLLVLQR